MNASASDRLRLHRHLEELLGPEDAATLMEHLPPDEWDRLARSSDLLALKDDVARLRDEMGDVRRELRTELGELAGRMVEHVDLRVRATVGDATRLLVFAMLTSQATLVGLVFAAVRLG
jgi:hypothetical protein